MKRNRNAEVVIANANIVLPDRILSNGVLILQDERIVDISCEPVTTQFIDFGGDFIIPGLIDLHVHGCGGYDTMDTGAGSLQKMASALLKQGTTAFLATTMTAPESQLQAVLAAGKTFCQVNSQAELLGFHMEGPCISPNFRGAQKKADLSESPVALTAEVKILTLAPEMAAASQYIKMAQEVGIILSAGHSGASYEQMQAAIDAGIHYVTHAFNAMPGIHHRRPGLLSAALLDSRVTIELIADGVHVHPAVLNLALRLKGPENVVLVSDGTRAVGMPDGEYDLGGQTVRLHQGKMTLPDGTIAGSAAPLLAGVRFMTKVAGRPLYEAVRMATLNPARLMKQEDRLGSLEKGKEATFLRLSPGLMLNEIWVRGVKAGKA